MKAVIVETNILVVANRKSDQAGPDCLLACVDALETAKKKQIVAIDSGTKIFKEYFHHVNRAGQPGLGDAFIKWLWDNQAYPKHCERVDITPTPKGENDFEEFPDDPGLSKFDPSDRKFVVVALKSKYHPMVLNATDSDWWLFRTALEKHQVFVKFLCPDLVQRS